MSLLKNINIINKLISNCKKIFINKKIRNVIFFIIISLIFSLSFRQAPIYQSNQHTKFLHGFAKADYGYLRNDWLAKTIDPLPEFSFLVYLTIKFLNEYFFYFYFVIILGVFIYCLLKISDNLFFNDSNKSVKILLFTIIITLHSTLLDSYFFKFFKYKITELLMEKGVAEQYLLGSYFQPCVFGVFLLLSILLFLKERQYLSIIFLAIPSIFHSTYLFSSAILTLTYMIIIYIDKKNLKKVFLLGVFSFILVFPVLVYNLIYLGPTSSEITRQALNIIVNFRIPQHTDLSRWINLDAILKLIIIMIAIIMTKGKKIFLILFVPCLIAVLSIILQLFINNDFIAFLAPWRVSVWLVPLSTSLIISYLINLIFKKINILNIKMINITIYLVCGIIILSHITYGMNGLIKQFNEYLNKDHGQMMNYVNEYKKTSDVFLIPPDLMEFRLNTGVPVFVTYKSHPYKDVELLEWYERIAIAQNIYNNNTKNNCNLIEKLKKEYNITHVVIKKKQFEWNLICAEEIYRDNDYKIYKIK